MATPIHRTAIVHPDTVLADDVEIGPFAVIGPGVRLGAGCSVGPSSVLERVYMGKDNHVSAFVCIGGEPQVRPRPERLFGVVVGDGNTFREGVTVHRGTVADTVIGSGCLLMANSHVGHDCKIDNEAILVNGALLAGHVEVGAGAVISGNAAIHQFTRVGTLAVLSGLSGAVMDILPYCVASGPRAKLCGLNLVGLRRAKIPRKRIAELKAAYKTLFFSGLTFRDALKELTAGDPGPEVRTLIAFCEGSRRSFTRPRLSVGGKIEGGRDE